MEKEYFARANLEQLKEYSHVVTFYYKGSQGFGRHTCAFKFTYLPEKKEWIYEESDIHSYLYSNPDSNLRAVEKLTGLHRSEFPLLMMQRLEKDFELRAVFYDKVASLAGQDELKVEIENVSLIEGERGMFVFQTYHAQTKLLVNFFFGEAGEFSHCLFREAGNVSHTTFGESVLAYPGIKKYIQFLGNESEYRMKLLFLG